MYTLKQPNMVKTRSKCRLMGDSETRW